MATEKEYLVFSKLAYINFDEVIEIGKTVNQIDYSIKDRSEQTVAWQNDIDQMSNWQLINYVNNNDTSGYCGAAFRNTETGEIIIANRGTEPSILNNSKLPADLITDLKIALVDNPLCRPDQVRDALNFVADTLAKVSGRVVDRSDVPRFVEKYNVSFTGHSLGGGLAAYQTYVTGGRAITFNGVGIGQEFGLDHATASKYNVLNIINEDDFIGNYGIHLGEERILSGNLAKTGVDKNAISLMAKTINKCAEYRVPTKYLAAAVTAELLAMDENTRNYILDSFATKAHSLETLREHVDPSTNKVDMGRLFNSYYIRQLDGALLNLSSSVSSEIRGHDFTSFNGNLTNDSRHTLALSARTLFDNPAAVGFAPMMGESIINTTAIPLALTMQGPGGTGPQPGIYDILMIVKQQEAELARLQKEREQYQGEPLTPEKAAQLAKTHYVQGEDTQLALRSEDLQRARHQLQKDEIWSKDYFGRQYGADNPLWKYVPDFLKSGARKAYEHNLEVIDKGKQELDRREADITAQTERLQERLQTPEARMAMEEKTDQYMKEDAKRLAKLENIDTKLEELQKATTLNTHQAAGLFVKQEGAAPEQSLAAWQRITDIMEVTPRPDIPGVEKLRFSEAREYRLQAKAIIEREGCWPGQAADVEIAIKMRTMGYPRDNIRMGISQASPETVNMATSRQNYDYSRDIIGHVEALGYGPPEPGLHL